jgi:MFS family permease
MSQMAPILPLYIAELGIDDPADVARWSGIVFGCNFISLAIFSPIWGRLSDRLGRKPMILRASGWLGLIMIGMGFAQSVWHLVILRLLQGCLSGFQAAVIPLLAQETPKRRSGWAMGIYFLLRRYPVDSWAQSLAAGLVRALVSVMRSS